MRQIIAYKVAQSHSICLDFAVLGKDAPEGWVLLQGKLVRRGGGYDARIYFDQGSGFSEDRYLEIPTSAKGVINEVFWLPSGITRMQLLPMIAPGEFELLSISLVKIGSIERVWRMARRVASTLLVHSKQKRSVIQLDFFRLLTDLRGAYRAASSLRAYAPAPDYSNWVARFDTLNGIDYRQIKRQIDNWKCSPHFDLILVSDSAMDVALQHSLESLREQVYQDFYCTVLGGNKPTPGLPASSKGVGRETVFIAQDRAAQWLTQFNKSLCGDAGVKWVMILKAGDVLAPHALYHFVCATLRTPVAAMLYADDDVQDANERRCLPNFKPDWSPQLLRSTNYIGRTATVRADVLQMAGALTPRDLRDSHALLLRVCESSQARQIVHIPAVLLHRGDAEPSVNDEATSSYLLGRKNVAAVDVIKSGCYRLRYGLPHPLPMVSILIPTRDAPALIRQCVDSILQKSTYPEYEIVIVDNQSTDAEVLRYLAGVAQDSRVRVLRYDAPFNFAAINNFAARHAAGEVLCLLNNDTEVISPDWMEEMLGHLVQDKVGVVGAKLLYPDGRVQHGGDAVGVGGVANHLHVFLGRDDPGYCNRAIVAQDLSAVTAACMMTWRKLYLDMGGMDEVHLPVAFNDVDYCLRVREFGHRVVWTPHAELYHHESVSRGKDDTPEKQKRAKGEVAYMRKRWKRVLQNDPFYNPNLSYERADFSLSHAPLVQRPWHK